jgi:hypothetical protein
VPPIDPASTLTCALIRADVPARSLPASACACVFAAEPAAELVAVVDDREPPEDEQPATTATQASTVLIRRRRTFSTLPARSRYEPPPR